jgi:uncharacterized protein
MVRSTHPRTIEVTTEEHLTENGDCIIGVGASKGCAGLDPGVKEGLKRSGSKVKIRIVVGQAVFDLKACGDARLELTHERDVVIRRSDYVSDRTLAVGASSASIDIPRTMVRLLQDERAEGRLEIEVD